MIAIINSLDRADVENRICDRVNSIDCSEKDRDELNNLLMEKISLGLTESEAYQYIERWEDKLNKTK
jgi:hypothetical protein